MFKTKCKKTVSKMILSFILITLTLLSGCQKNSTHSAIEFGTIDVSEIDKIELSGTTGGKDGNYSYTLSDQEKKEFVHLLNQVELGDEVDKLKVKLDGSSVVENNIDAEILNIDLIIDNLERFNKCRNAFWKWRFKRNWLLHYR